MQTSRPSSAGGQPESDHDPFGFWKIAEVKAKKPHSPPKPSPVRETSGPQIYYDSDENKENEDPELQMSLADTSFKTPPASIPNTPKRSPHKPHRKRTPLRPLTSEEVMERMPKLHNRSRRTRPKRPIKYADVDDEPLSASEEVTPRPAKSKRKSKRAKPEQKREDPAIELEQRLHRAETIRNRYVGDVDDFELDVEEVSSSS